MLEVTQFSPTEFELIPGIPGHTSLTFWFVSPDGQTPVLRYLVRVGEDDEVPDRLDTEYAQLQDQINELFPNSLIQLIPIADKVIIRGQARDRQRRRYRAGARNRRHRYARFKCRVHQPVTRIADQRGSGIAHKRDVLAILQTCNETLCALCLVVIVQRFLWRFDADMR